MKYKQPSWALFQNIRMSGLVEDECQHEVGHPNKEWLKQNDPDDKRALAIHGCDGCCSTEETIYCHKMSCEKKVDKQFEFCDFHKEKE